jgi:hypothetical protein
MFEPRKDAGVAVGRGCLVFRPFRNHRRGFEVYKNVFTYGAMRGGDQRFPDRGEIDAADHTVRYRRQAQAAVQRSDVLVSRIVRLRCGHPAGDPC